VSDNTSMFIRHTGEISVAYIKVMWPVNFIGRTEPDGPRWLSRYVLCGDQVV
jgi:hypothetical protein